SVMGKSLVPVLQNVTAQPRSSALSQFASGYSLRTDRYRYTIWGEEGADGTELYDHQTDPQELKNLASDNSTAELRAQLHKQILVRIAEARSAPEGVRQVLPPAAAARNRR
ncbi:MAG: DUF4976 domain-containing protein, partial [Planctomycetaceae bacterium]|nr:DUF4976 domain-containing protein [Planctomycetaceae bacterium]